ncbi:MAG TPA: DUF1269 domain-containing protein [Gaiellaceae bacterium]|nr:DUF1269 domain-containing protein [Gaiellaceae bacterium]
MGASTLIAAAYADVEAAADALERVRGLEGVEDAAVVLKDAARGVELRQGRQPAVGEAVVAGGTIGLVVGFALGGPIGGALVGMAGGGGYGARDTGIPDERMRRFGRELAPGRAAVFALVEDADEAARRLEPYEGELVVAEL